MNALVAWWSALSVAGRRGVVGGVLGVLALGVGGAVILTGGEGGDPPPSTTTAPSTTTEPAATTTTEPDTRPRAPLTGLVVDDPLILFRPALAVKVDNLDVAGETAVPQAGLNRADIVYEEIVEGDITRLVPVFHSQQPGRVGPVRSARTTDVQLLPQLGRPLLAWSGGNEGVTAAVRSSPSIIDVGVDRATGSYARDRSRRAPHNLFVAGDELFGLAPDDAGFPPTMFTYRSSGEPQPETARPSQGVDITWGGGRASSPVSWRWEPEFRSYVRNQNGRVHMTEEGDPVSAANVVVLVTSYGSSSADTRSPEAQTVGSGEAFVFTAGGVIYGSWDRPAIDATPTLLDEAGNPIKLTPGRTWIELPKPGTTTAVDG